MAMLAIYDQTHNDTICRMMLSAIKSSSREWLYQELSLESLSDRRLYPRLVYVFNIVPCSSRVYLYSLLPDKQRSYDLVISNLFINFNSNANFFKNCISLTVLVSGTIYNPSQKY